MYKCSYEIGDGDRPFTKTEILGIIFKEDGWRIVKDKEHYYLTTNKDENHFISIELTKGQAKYYCQKYYMNIYVRKGD